MLYLDHTIHTVKAAKNWFENDIYVLKSDGWYLYEVEKHALLKMGNGDLRVYVGTQDFIKTAPVILSQPVAFPDQ
jgi:hypothetical protein